MWSTDLDDTENEVEAEESSARFEHICASVLERCAFLLKGVNGPPKNWLEGDIEENGSDLCTSDHKCSQRYSALIQMHHRLGFCIFVCGKLING